MPAVFTGLFQTQLPAKFSQGWYYLMTNAHVQLTAATWNGVETQDFSENALQVNTGAGQLLQRKTF